MDLSRRDCLRIGILTGAIGAAGGCARLANHLAERDIDPSLPAGDVDETARLINRVSFGPRPGDVRTVKAIGPEAYVASQLSADVDEDLRLRFLINRLDVFDMESFDSQDLSEDEVAGQLHQAAFLRATYGKHQLRERLVDFWTNHFNIYSGKGLTTYRKAAEEAHVIRDHALQTFPKLLRASAHSPAMLMYLDNEGNVAGRPNENYAREIMELHTMGVKSGYTQRDVQEVARCFTGWTMENRFLHRKWTFRFDDSHHDDGVKHVLGHTIAAGGGEQDAEVVLDILASHPATAHFISKKICNYFLGDAGDTWVGRMEKIYADTHGDIPSMLRPMLLSKELIDSPPILKRPFDYMVSSLRALDAETDGGGALQVHLDKMGEPLYQWPMPDGYPTRTAAWTGTMLPRWNFAYGLTSGDIGGTSIAWDRLKADRDAERIFEITHGRRPTAADAPLVEKVAHELDHGEDSYGGAGFLCLASPSFQWR